MGISGNDMTLSAKLEVKDSFTTSLNKFKNTLNTTETAFTKFLTKFDEVGKKVESRLDSIETKMEKVAKNIIEQGDKVSKSMIDSTDKATKKQEEQIKNLDKMYKSMGKNIQGVFKEIQTDANILNKTGLKVKINSGSGSGSSKKQNGSGGLFDSSKSENLITGILGGNFGKVIGSLGLIGAGITGATKILTTLDNWMQQGFNVLNTMSTGLLSVDGLKDAVQTSSQFETNRVALDTLYGNNSAKGQQYYQMGTKIAKDTFYSESSVGELQKKLAGSGVEYKAKDLMTILDMASVKPELGAEHAGFSIIDSMFGRPQSLKTNYMIDNKEIQKYFKTLQKTDPKDAKNWKDAFNSKGSVNNKQEYFDLLINYIQKETSYNGLTERYAHTLNGQIERLSGNWETLRADLLGIDANGTGMVKPGKITVFSAIEKSIDNLEKWLNKPETGKMLDALGGALGTAIESIGNSFQKLLDNGDMTKLAKSFSDIGDSVAKCVDKLTSSPEFMKLIDDLPNIIEKILGSQIIPVRAGLQSADAGAKGHPLDATYYWLKGQDDKWSSTLGLKSTEDAILGKEDPKYGASYRTTASEQGKGWAPLGFIRSWMLGSDNFLTDANASTVLAKSDLSDDQKTQVSDLLKKDDGKATYGDIYIQSISANNFDEFLDSLKKAQANKK